MTNFQRSYSKVYWGNDSSHFVPVSSLPHQKYYYPQVISDHHLSNIVEESSAYRSSSNLRRSIRSHDSGFNDSDHSPNTTSSSSQISAHCQDNESPKNDENQNYLSPNASPESPANASETMQTPPTVIRKKITTFFSPAARRISFSAPNSPEAENPPKINETFHSMETFVADKKSTSRLNDSSNSFNNNSLNMSRAKNSSLRRGKTISPSNNSSYRRRANRRRLLDCVSQVSGSTGDVYTLASSSSDNLDDQKPEMHHHYESLIEVNKSRSRYEEYNNETVTFGAGDESNASAKESPEKLPERQRLPLPTYDELYPPNSCSTPKMMKAKNIQMESTPEPLDHTKASTTAIISTSQCETPRSQSRNLDYLAEVSPFQLSLPTTLNWDTLTYIEYTNPLLNGHATSVQFWLDEMRSTYCHEILSTLQTKSVLYEAARSLKLNPTIASKLIYQIQLKAIAIETNFDEIERIFESHAKLMKRLQRTSESIEIAEESIEIADNKFKEKISDLMKALTGNVCQFMSRLNSKIIFQKVSGCTENDGDLKSFERSVKAVIDLCQDLRVTCETKIDDLETSVILREFHTLKRSVLKTIRKVFRRLVNIIVSRIEENAHEMLLRANINTIAMLPTETVYNSSERFSSLNDAFLSSGIIRVLLMICLDTQKTSIRALSLRALATICSSAEMIQQFLEIGGLDVVTDILTDDKRNNVKFEPELREAVSVLTQVTAPWHHGDSGNIDDLLKLSIDNLVTRLTVLLDTTECLQTLMLCAACLNNLSRKSSLTFYSLMDNRSTHRMIQACDRYQQRTEFQSSAIFLYVSFFFSNRNSLMNATFNCFSSLTNISICDFLFFFIL